MRQESRRQFCSAMRTLPMECPLVARDVRPTQHLNPHDLAVNFPHTVLTVQSSCSRILQIETISRIQRQHQNNVPRLLVWLFRRPPITNSLRNLTTDEKKNSHSAVKFTVSNESVTHQLRCTSYPQGSPQPYHNAMTSQRTFTRTIGQGTSPLAGILDTILLLIIVFDPGTVSTP